MKELFEVVFVNLKIILKVSILEFSRILRMWFGTNG